MDGKAFRCCASWVVFGGLYQDEMDVRQLEDEGFKLKGDAGIYQVGDVNGDGLADIGQSGRVVFGKSDTEPIPPGYVPREVGFDFRGTLGLDGAAGLSDVNGDGLFDVGITAPNADYGGRNVGAAFVVYGSRKGVDVNVEDLGGRGFRLDGPRAASEDSHLAAGYQLAGPGDITGDGLADILVDALGRAYLVPG
jgi:hypothetical protein